MAELKDKILIVDDEIASRDELSTILKDEYEILEADTDESVMETLQDNEGRIALVIINLEMQRSAGTFKGERSFCQPCSNDHIRQVGRREAQLPGEGSCGFPAQAF